MLIAGIIIMVVAGILAFVSQRNKKRVYELRSVERRSCNDVVQMANEVKSDMAEFGPTEGTFSQVCELVGDVVCDRPLTSQIGNRPCVHYSVTVTRKYEERYWDSQANVHKTRQQTETVSTQSESTPFRLRDESGEVEVDPQGATFDGLVQTVDRFEPTQGFMPQVRFGNFSFSLPAQFHDSGDRRTIGYSYKEQILPAEGKLTVIGEINDKMGRLAMRRGKEQKLTISTRSREDLVDSAKSAATGFMVAAIASGIVGLVLTVVGALQR